MALQAPRMATELLAPFGAPVTGLVDLRVDTPAPLAEAGPGALTWVKALDHITLAALARLDGALIVHPAPETEPARLALAAAGARNALVQAAAPRLLFAKVLARWFAHLEAQVPAGIDPRAFVDPSARLGADVTVAAFAWIGPEVVVGDGSIVHPHAVLHSRTVVGRRCIVNAHVVLGGRGFGFVRDDDGAWVHFPQVGRVVLEDDVEIQAGSLVDRPALGETVVRRGTKIDNLVHVGHGARVGPHAIVAACSEIGASVVVDEGAWIGPHVCSLENIHVGRDARVGLGAVLLDDVAPGATVAGAPAEPTDVLRRRRAALRRLLDQHHEPEG